MFCKNCGSNIGDNVKFCPSCGQPTGISGSRKTTTGAGASSGQNPKYPYDANLGYGHNSDQGYSQNYTQNYNQTSGPNKFHSFASKSLHGVPGQKYKKQFNIGNYIVWAGCLIALISLFLDFASVNAGFLGSQSVKLIDAEDAPFFIGIFVIVAVVNIFKLNIVDLIGSLIAAFFAYLDLKSIKEAYEQYGSLAKSLADSMIEYGAGRTLLVLGIILMVGGSIAAVVLGIKAKKTAGF